MELLPMIWFEQDLFEQDWFEQDLRGSAAQRNHNSCLAGFKLPMPACLS
jgi:hypothetical protein